MLGYLWASDLESRCHHAVVDRECIRGQVNTLHELESAHRTGLSGLLQLLQNRVLDLGILAQLVQTLNISSSDGGTSNGIREGQEGLGLGNKNCDQGGLKRITMDVDLLDKIAACAQDVLNLFRSNVFTLCQL